MTLNDTVNKIKPPCQTSMRLAQKRLDGIAKPLNSLGKLEKLIVRAAGILGSHHVRFDKKCVAVMCADNGVVEEGVTQVSNEVTAIVARNMVQGRATVSVMAKKQNADLFVVDIGIYQDMSDEKGIIDKKIRSGTENFTKKPAMSRDEAVKAIKTGIKMACELAEKGYGLVATGEMGIGNTTTSSAMAAVFLDKPAAEVTGRGAGLSTGGLNKKISAIERAIALHNPDRNDPLDVLSKVGGLDIAGLCGVFLGCAAHRVPAVVDGFISSVAALTAIRLCPAAREYMFGSHISNEPAGRMLIEELDIPYFLDCEMCLGEGTGAVAAFPVFDLAVEVYNHMSSFDEANIEAYVPQK